MNVWGRGHLTHEDCKQYKLSPSTYAKEHKLQVESGQFSYYFFPLTITAEFGSLPTTKKEKAKAIKTIKKNA